MTKEFEIVEIRVEEGVDVGSKVNKLSLNNNKLINYTSRCSVIGGTLLSFNVV